MDRKQYEDLVMASELLDSTESITRNTAGTLETLNKALMEFKRGGDLQRAKDLINEVVDTLMVCDHIQDVFNVEAKGDDVIIRVKCIPRRT